MKEETSDTANQYMQKIMRQDRHIDDLRKGYNSTRAIRIFRVAI